MRNKKFAKRVLFFVLLMLALFTPPGSRLQQIITLGNVFAAEWSRGDLQIALLSTVSNFTGTLVFVAVAGYLFSFFKLIVKSDSPEDYNSSETVHPEIMSIPLFLSGVLLFKYFPRFEAALYIMPPLIVLFRILPELSSVISGNFKKFRPTLYTLGKDEKEVQIKFLNTFFWPAYLQLLFKNITFIALVVFATEIIIDFNAGLGSLVQLRSEEWHLSGAVFYLLASFIVFVIIHRSLKLLKNAFPVSHNSKEQV